MAINLIKEVTIIVTPLDAELILGALCYYRSFSNGHTSPTEHHRLSAMIKILTDESIVGGLEE